MMIKSTYYLSVLLQRMCKECEEKNKTIAELRQVIDANAEYLRILESINTKTTEWYKLLQDQNVITSDQALSREPIPDCFETPYPNPEPVVDHLIECVKDQLISNTELIKQLESENKQLKKEVTTKQNVYDKMQEELDGEIVKLKSELLQNMKNVDLANTRMKESALKIHTWMTGRWLTVTKGIIFIYIVLFF